MEVTSGNGPRDRDVFNLVLPHPQQAATPPTAHAQRYPQRVATARGAAEDQGRGRGGDPLWELIRMNEQDNDALANVNTPFGLGLVLVFLAITNYLIGPWAQCASAGYSGTRASRGGVSDYLSLV